ncbi:MAG: hypothetical protein AAGD14_19930 [Planctomycetota bacterium]
MTKAKKKLRWSADRPFGANERLRARIYTYGDGDPRRELVLDIVGKTKSATVKAPCCWIEPVDNSAQLKIARYGMEYLVIVSWGSEESKKASLQFIAQGSAD